MRIYRAIKSAAQRAGINDIGISTHTMRKTWVKGFLEETPSQNPFDTLQVAGQWSSRDSMMHYIPRTDEAILVDETQSRLSDRYADTAEYVFSNQEEDNAKTQILHGLGSDGDIQSFKEGDDFEKDSQRITGGDQVWQSVFDS